MSIKSLPIPNGFFKDYDQPLTLSYELFGQPLGEAPVVVINHALTGNSSVAGIKGWWNRLVGADLTINTKVFTILAFNIPGNGYDGNEISNYTYFTTKKVAEMFWYGLDQLGISQLYALVGGSLGGGIAWEMALQRADTVQHLIPIATHYKASDWLIGNTHIQELILKNSSRPVYDARVHAMLLYRTPQSLTDKFGGTFHEESNRFEVEHWLDHHGKTLEQRFTKSSYQLVNHLLKTIGRSTTHDRLISYIKTTRAQIHIIAVSTDYMFTNEEQFELFTTLKKYKKEVWFHSIKSPHGHDAFLMEYNQLHHFLKPLFAAHQLKTAFK